MIEKRKKILPDVTSEDVEERVLVLRNQRVLIDSDVAELYGIETKRVNEAVRNNPEKFPYGYIFVLDKYEKQEVVENFDHLNKLKFSKVQPTAFTERGLYMLATILKSERAISTTLAIVDKFVRWLVQWKPCRPLMMVVCSRKVFFREQETCLQV